MPENTLHISAQTCDAIRLKIAKIVRDTDADRQHLPHFSDPAGLLEEFPVELQALKQGQVGVSIGHEPIPAHLQATYDGAKHRLVGMSMAGRGKYATMDGQDLIFPSVADLALALNAAAKGQDEKITVEGLPGHGVGRTP